jgi:hypothetical protein
MQLAVFPALTRRPSLRKPEPVKGDASEANCFYHASNRAVCPCDECGRFLCGLCELDLDRRKLCPACLDAGVRGRKNQILETHRKLYDSIALALATYPALMFWPIVVSAPATIYYCVRYWKAPGSMLPRTKFRFYLAIFLAVSQIAFVIFMIVEFSQMPNQPPVQVVR